MVLKVKTRIELFEKIYEARVQVNDAFDALSSTKKSAQQLKKNEKLVAYCEAVKAEQKLIKDFIDSGW
jgi:hypothetical protein